MKHFIIAICGIFMFFSFSFALNFELADFTPALDKKIANMKTTKEKVDFLQSFISLLSSKKFTTDKNARLFRDLQNYSQNMLNVFQSELYEENWNTNNTNKNKQSIKTIKTLQSDLPDLSSKFSNVDIQKIREEVLSWHNNERSSLGLKSYKYNLNLEWSATLRAENLKNLSITSNTHIREEWDNYFNYNSILNRFSNLWINFPSVKWWASLSESVGYWYYKCNSSDCTQKLIDAIKKTWTNLIMKEKSYNWSHYKAVTVKYFTQMWIWISVDYSKNRYYFVLHYWIDF